MPLQHITVAVTSKHSMVNTWVWHKNCKTFSLNNKLETEYYKSTENKSVVLQIDNQQAEYYSDIPSPACS